MSTEEKPQSIDSQAKQILRIAHALNWGRAPIVLSYDDDDELPEDRHWCASLSHWLWEGEGGNASHRRYPLDSVRAGSPEEAIAKLRAIAQTRMDKAIAALGFVQRMEGT